MPCLGDAVVSRCQGIAGASPAHLPTLRGRNIVTRSLPLLHLSVQWIGLGSERRVEHKVGLHAMSSTPRSAGAIDMGSALQRAKDSNRY